MRIKLRNVNFLPWANGSHGRRLVLEIALVGVLRVGWRQKTRDSKEASRRRVHIVQGRDDKGLYKGSSSGNGGKANSNHMAQ